MALLNRVRNDRADVIPVRPDGTGPQAISVTVWAPRDQPRLHLLLPAIIAQDQNRFFDQDLARIQARTFRKPFDHAGHSFNLRISIFHRPAKNRSPLFLI